MRSLDNSDVAILHSQGNPAAIRTLPLNLSDHTNMLKVGSLSKTRIKSSKTKRGRRNKSNALGLKEASGSIN